MKRFLVVIGAGCVLFACAGVASATTYLWGANPPNWVDAQKTGGDGLLCWAASSANMLAWGGWDGGPGLTGAQDIYNHFKADWANDVGSPMYGTEWWFTGRTTPSYVGAPAGITYPATGGGFYPTVEWNDWNADGDPTDDIFGWVPSVNNPQLSSIKFYIDNGIPDCITITGPYLHSLSVWGYDWAGGAAQAGTIYVTDSDTPLALDSYAVTQHADTSWYIDNYRGLGVFRIDEIQRLKVNSQNIDPSLGPTGVIPEPVTMAGLLLGLGSLTTYVRRRRAA